MAIVIDYSDAVTPQFIIKVPRADLLLIQTVPSEVRQININDLRIELNNIMDGASDVWALTNHVHTPPLTVAGVTLARVVTILSPYAIEFEDGLYSVNVVGGNSNVADKVVKNQVGVNTANSAGLQDPFSLQAAAFGAGEVHISTGGTTGTTFPKGTRGFPVDNVTDALTIALSRGINRFRLLTDFTLSSGDFSNDFVFVGDTPSLVCTIDPGVNVTNSDFTNLTIQGTLDGGNALRSCWLLDINFFNGVIFQCGLAGTITLGGTAPANILQSFSNVAGGGVGQYPIIDLGGTQAGDLIVRDWQGGLGLRNRSGGAASTSIDMSSGRVVLESTVTAGLFTVRGVCDVEDSSTGTATVDDRTLNKDVIRTRKHTTNRFETNPVGGLATIYDDDGTTVLETAQLSEDVAAAQSYRGQGAERRNGFA